jgi:hypothetical protein
MTNGAKITVIALLVTTSGPLIFSAFYKNIKRIFSRLEHTGHIKILIGN